MRRSVVSLLVVLAVAGAVGATEPPVISWRDTAEHVGEYVSVEGDLVAVRIERDICFFEFAPDDPDAFRAAMVIPMISALPSHPETVFVGRRVHITGTVRRFKGRTEMVLESPGQIEIVDHAGAPESTTTTTTTTTLPKAHAAPTLPPAPPPTLPPLPPTTLPPTSAPSAATPTTIVPHIDPCPAARQEWRTARDAVRTAMRRLDDCLRDERPRCRQESAALAPALSTLEWAEQSMADACP